MVRGAASAVVARPVEVVYDFVVVRFFDNYPRWAPEVVELRPLGPARVERGTRGRQVRVDQGRRSTTTFAVAQLEPGRSVRFDGEGSAAFSIRYDFAPAGENACRLGFEFRLDRLDLFMRPFEKLIRLAIEDGSARTVRNIKGLIEREH